MLGEKIGEETGRVTNRRVVLREDGQPLMEVTFESKGHLLGVAYDGLITYKGAPRVGGALFGEGNGVLMTQNGDSVTFLGNGIGHTKGPGNVTVWRGAIYYQTNAERLLRLNGIAAIFEHEVAADGTAKSTVWEWK
ncbi:MAG: hypothetical protein HYV63_29865 [Candidatus Schekmanbacteria bacterium]|nr:hypothetical protein [Candidatus Schekmanbacteria bacterium]